MNNPTQTFTKRFSYVWPDCIINWLKFILNITLIDNSFSFWGQIKQSWFVSLSLLCFKNLQ